MEQLIKIVIPENVLFDDLKLTRKSSGDISFDFKPINAICLASGMSVELLKSEDNVSALITQWYVEHKLAGGAPDPVAEELFSEVIAENKAGQATSFKPGKA